MGDRRQQGGALTSVILVHGTGVREVGYARTLARFRAGLASRCPDVTVLPCAWGDALGALPSGGPSLIPGKTTQQKSSAKAAVNGPDEVMARRYILDIDPLHQLSLIALAWQHRLKADLEFPGEETASAALQKYIAELPGQQALWAELGNAGLTASFRESLSSIAESDVVTQALARIRIDDGEWSEFVTALGEAVIARAAREADVDLGPEQRQRLVDLVVGAFHGGQLGIGRLFFGAALETTMRLGGAFAEQRFRGPLDNWANPSVGDILRYLAFGETVRDFIEDRAAAAAKPIILIGHSLGGIACLDLLASRPISAVTQLITVGSQGSRLYQIGALPNLPEGSELPESFPLWTNIYSRYDLLSYLAEPVFAPHVTDVEIASSRAMPAAHSAYFTNSKFYELVSGLVRRAGS